MPNPRRDATNPTLQHAGRSRLPGDSARGRRAAALTRESATLPGGYSPDTIASQCAEQIVMQSADVCFEGHPYICHSFAGVIKTI